MKKNISDIFDCYCDTGCSFAEIPEVSANHIYELTQTKIKGNKNMKSSFKGFKTILIAAILTIILSLSAFAAYSLLSPAEVAKETGNINLSDFFAENDTKFDIEPQESNGYSIGLLGIASGENLSFYTDTQADKTYVVGYISKSNGEELKDYTGIVITPLVSGYEPRKVNIFTLNDGKRHGFIKDGIEYFIIECSNINIFANNTVYIAVFEGIAPTADKFTMNSDGSISYAEKYNGVKAMFELPLDKAKANPEAIELILKNTEE